MSSQRLLHFLPRITRRTIATWCTVLCLGLSAHAAVDIRTEHVWPNKLKVSIRNTGATFNGLVSNLVFTVRWPETSGVSLDVVSFGCPTAMAVSGGTVVSSGGYSYQTFVSVGMVTLQDACPTKLLTTDEWREVCVLEAESEACVDFEVLNDTYTADNNRNFFVSLGGAGATGSIVQGAIAIGEECPCPNMLDMVIDPDYYASEASWEVLDESTLAVMCSGASYGDGMFDITQGCCLPDGCYRLKVYDSGNNGFVSSGTTGGYKILVRDGGARIIDNTDNFNGTFSGSLSALSSSQGFCLPLGTQELIFSSRDKLDWIVGQYVVANEDAAVAAQWGVGDQTDDGYEFWIYDPNGSYSYKRFRSHAVSDGFANIGSARTCHMKINNWSSGQHIPAYTLMNVRVRPRVNGVNGQWGPACRFKIDPERAACPLTKLIDDPSNQFYSCNVTRALGNGSTNRVYAKPVSGGNKYQFRFRIPGEGFEVVRTTTTYYCQLNWTGSTALQVGKTYDVEVRVSKDNGTTWCITDAVWGDMCQVSIVTTLSLIVGAPETAQEERPAFAVWPNPSDVHHFNFQLSGLALDVEEVELDLMDALGRRTFARAYPLVEGATTQQVDLPEGTAPGLYTARFRAGGEEFIDRVVLR